MKLDVLIVNNFLVEVALLVTLKNDIQEPVRFVIKRIVSQIIVINVEV